VHIENIIKVDWCRKLSGICHGGLNKYLGGLTYPDTYHCRAVSLAHRAMEGKEPPNISVAHDTDIGCFIVLTAKLTFHTGERFADYLLNKPVIHYLTTVPLS
jgi:hypothetical protein